ncbi:MAG: S41 family peptidase [Bacteroidota bacterium]
MKIISTLIVVLFSISTISGQTKFQKDFTYYWQTVHANFAYFDRQHINWDKVKKIYQPIVDTISDKTAFIHLLETVNNELYNGHVFLNTNTPASNRVIPTGADMKIGYANQQFVIAELRPGFNAELCGLKKGMIITKFNDQLVSEALLHILPRSAARQEKEIYDYAATFLLAGTHNIKRKITIQSAGKEKYYYPDSIPNKTESDPISLLETKLLPGNTGYIRINNSLGNSDLIEAFDLALDGFIKTSGLVLDLRETPSGGTTTIARAIMGRFIDKELPYQKHIYTAEELETGIKRTSLELVSPRGKTYKKPLIVLVSYWTGSMGEGMAIGFDGMKRATIAGTKMAGLLGEIYSFETPELKIPFSFPCVQLRHINGQPREDFVPAILIQDQGKAVEKALEALKKR